jgi:electron transfer flavoprotein beta subunit
MKIIVPVKRVIDPYAKIRVKADHSGVEQSNVKMALNPFDEIAVEEAVRLREQNIATEVIVVTIGVAPAGEMLRTALALGADRGIYVPFEGETQPLGVAKILAALVQREQAQLVIMGKQAIDDDCNQTGQMLAALLDWPQGTYASRLTIADGLAHVVREIDGGLETLELSLPAVITTDLRLNTPRYATLPNIMKAKKKPLDTVQAAELGVDLTPRLKILQVTEPPKRQAGIKVPDVASLVNALRTIAKVI